MKVKAIWGRLPDLVQVAILATAYGVTCSIIGLLAWSIMRGL